MSRSRYSYKLLLFIILSIFVVHGQVSIRVILLKHVLDDSLTVTSYSTLKITIPKKTIAWTSYLTQFITPSTSILPMTRTTTVLTCPPPTLTPRTVDVLVGVIVKGANPWAATSTATVAGTTTKTVTANPTILNSASFIRTPNVLSSTPFPGVLYNCNNDAAAVNNKLAYLGFLILELALFFILG